MRDSHYLDGSLREDLLSACDLSVLPPVPRSALQQTLSPQLQASYSLPADAESNANVIEDSLEHMPGKLIERDLATLFDESRRVQVFDQSGVEYVDDYARSFKIVTQKQLGRGSQGEVHQCSV